MMYPLVSELAADGIPVAVTCRVLKLARQPYYRWLAATVGTHELDEACNAVTLTGVSRHLPVISIARDEHPRHAAATVTRLDEHVDGLRGSVVVAHEVTDGVLTDLRSAAASRRSGVISVSWWTSAACRDIFCITSSAFSPVISSVHSGLRKSAHFSEKGMCRSVRRQGPRRWVTAASHPTGAATGVPGPRARCGPTSSSPMPAVVRMAPRVSTARAS